MTTLRILIADDHEIVRSGVAAVLESQPGWTVVAQVANGRDAVAEAERTRPDVVILDISMPELNGIEAARRILRAVPRAEVVILTMHESERVVRRILEAGARGYVSKSDVARSLVDAVEAVRHHRAFLSSAATTTIINAYVQSPHAPPAAKAGLTSREREVLQLVAEGKSSKEVASALGISTATAETHRRNIMQKLDLHSVTQLTRYAIRNELCAP